MKLLFLLSIAALMCIIKTTHSMNDNNNSLNSQKIATIINMIIDAKKFDCKLFSQYRKDVANIKFMHPKISKKITLSGDELISHYLLEEEAFSKKTPYPSKISKTNLFYTMLTGGIIGLWGYLNFFSKQTGDSHLLRNVGFGFISVMSLFVTAKSYCSQQKSRREYNEKLSHHKQIRSLLSDSAN